MILEKRVLAVFWCIFWRNHCCLLLQLTLRALRLKVVPEYAKYFTASKSVTPLFLQKHQHLKPTKNPKKVCTTRPANRLASYRTEKISRFSESPRVWTGRTVWERKQWAITLDVKAMSCADRETQYLQNHRYLSLKGSRGYGHDLA